MTAYEQISGEAHAAAGFTDIQVGHPNEPPGATASTEVLLDQPRFAGAVDLGLQLRDLPAVEPVDPGTLQPDIGAHTKRLLEEVRQGPGGVSDGKLVVDGLLARLGKGLEEHVAQGYAQGLTAAEIYSGVVGGATTYVSGRPPLLSIPGENMQSFALRLRKHQEVEVQAGGETLTLRRTCDGRYEREVYPLDSWPIIKGYNATGDVGRVQDMVDFYTLRILKHGYPFNGNRIEAGANAEPSDEQNYYAGRSQPPTYFYQIRVLGEHGGDAVYTHPPYVRAMERLWKHFNPDAELLEAQPHGYFHGYRRGGISPEGLPFSVYGDDTNNGRRYEDYIGRPESHWEDERTAAEAAARAPRESKARVRAETLVHLQAAGEWGWDMSTGRQADGKDLSHTNATNIVPLELQCMLADGAELLAYSYSVQRRYAESQGNMTEAARCYERELYFTDQRTKRLAFIRTYMRDPVKRTYHDLELLSASASYDRVRTYDGARRTTVISAAMLHTLYSGVTNAEDSLAVVGAVDKELLGSGGVAVTNIETGEQWDKPNDWAAPTRVGVCGPIHAAAKVASEDPGVARELLGFGEQVRVNALHGAECGYLATGTMVETVHAFDPTRKPVVGEYPKDARDPASPRNFSMRAEGVIEMGSIVVEDKFQRLVPARGRFLVGRHG
jgi:hypothetical protein